MAENRLVDVFQSEELKEVYGGTGMTQADYKTEFDLILVAEGASRAGLIKVIKEINGISLKEASAIVDSLPQRLKSGLTEEQALADKAKLESVGAVVELK